jgi:hypothetical protein
VIWKCIREISSSSDAVSKLVSIEKTRLALDDYYCKIYLDGSICLHAGYGKMVVRKTKGAQSCEVENEKRGGAIYVLHPRTAKQ